MSSFVESLETFGQNLADIKPTTFQGVPRIYTKFQEKILSKMSQKKLNILLKIPLVSSLIKKKLQAALGLTKVRVVVSGAAALPVSLIDWYKTIGIYIFNGYGMTENCCVCTALDPYQPLGVGSVGTVSSPSVKLKITDEGEICMTGPFLLDSYYKNEEVTNETLKNGWLHTGDLGTVCSQEGESYESMLIRLNDVTVEDIDEFGNIQINDGSGSTLMDDYYFEGNWPSIAIGDNISSLVNSFSILKASKISLNFLVNSFLLWKKKFLATCIVMVLPPEPFFPVKISSDTARSNPFISTPLCSKKPSSSAAIKALIN